MTILYPSHLQPFYDGSIARQVQALTFVDWYGEPVSPDVDLPDLEGLFSPCRQLRAYRIRAGLTQPRLSALCLIGALSLKLEQQHQQQNVLPLEGLMSLIAHVRDSSTVDTTHISKFEKGHALPWRRAILNLCYAFSVVLGETIGPEQLFQDIIDPSVQADSELEQRDQFEQMEIPIECSGFESSLSAFRRSLA